MFANPPPAKAGVLRARDRLAALRAKQRDNADIPSRQQRRAEARQAAKGIPAHEGKTFYYVGGAK